MRECVRCSMNIFAFISRISFLSSNLVCVHVFDVLFFVVGDRYCCSLQKNNNKDEWDMGMGVTNLRSLCYTRLNSLFQRNCNRTTLQIQARLNFYAYLYIDKCALCYDLMKGKLLCLNFNFVYMFTRLFLLQLQLVYDDLHAHPMFSRISFMELTIISLKF